MAVAVAAPNMAAVKEPAGTIPARRLTKEELLKSHQAYLEKQENDPHAQHEHAHARPVKQPILSEAYPPSTKSIRELEIIPLSELRVGEHHRGKAIVVKIASPPFIGAGAVSIVEDEFGNADRLAIYNQPDTSILSAVPEGCIVAVKEPFYRHNGSENDFMICVDHPSDVILLRFNDPIIPEPLRLGPLLQTADEWKNAGDRAFLERDFPTAVFCYSEALESSTDPSFHASIYSKRSGVNLILGRYDSAKADALKSLNSDSPSPHDWKAHYNAGRALYGLCKYSEAMTHLAKALELNPSNSSVQRDHERCAARLREEQTGEYDFSAMLASAQKSVHIDCGSFLSNTYVGTSPLHGRGLFAARDIKAGEIVFVEKATLMPNQYDPARSSAALYALTVRQLCENPSLSETLLDLWDGGYERSGKEGTIVDGVPVIDVYLVESIRIKNCFSAPRSTFEDTRPSWPSHRQARGLWAHASYMNHACVANTMRSFIGDVFISRATRDIKAGEELFQQYVPVRSLPDVRNKQFKDGWGFECACALCAGERRSSEAALARRKELLAAVEKLCNKKLPRKEILPESTIRPVEKLARQLEEAHEADVYDGLPRLTLIYPCNWLIGAYRGHKNHTKVIRYAKKVLRNFGFRVPEEDGGEWDPREIYSKSGNATLMTVHVVAALRRMAEAYEGLGQKEMAKRCIEAAKFGYMMVTGFENDLSNLDK